MSRRKRIIVILALLAAGCGAQARDGTAEAQLRAGAALYQQHCSHCHGPALDAASGVADLRAFTGDYAMFSDTVSNGRDIMPGFVFTEEELEALYAWVKSGGKPSAAE